ncbi:response regulator transcription factor [soil metagenome]
MRILIIEDEVRLAQIVQRVLRAEKFEVEVAERGDDGFEAALTGVFDVLVVDRMLPGMDGLTLVNNLREEGIDTPVLMLTALSDLPRRVEGLNAGADDYLGKPFAFEELIARLRALARRGARPMIEQKLDSGSISVDLATHQVTRDGVPVELTHKEFSMLETLLRNRDRVMTRDEILERVWGYDADPQGNVVELYVHYLRRKLDPPSATTATSVIRTVRGTGYQFRSS